MEGLVKGLINVALDHIQGGGDDDRDERDSQPRDERSRSSWAQVSTHRLSLRFIIDFLYR